VTVAISPKVSVAMCTYNGAAFVAEQLASIARQTVLPAELVISDDASSDDTLTVVRDTVACLVAERPEFAQVEVRIQANPSSLGVTKNFEHAIASTAREYVFLSDQDDVWAPNRVEVELAALETGAGFVFGDADLIDESGASLGHSLFDALDLLPRERSEILGQSPVDVLIRRNIVTGATAAFHRRVFEGATPFPASWVHDEWLAMVSALTGERFALTPVLIGYRQHGKNQIGVKRKTASSRMAKLTSDGRARNARLLQRASDLVDRVGAGGSLDVTPHATELVAQAVAHQTARSSFRSNRLARFPQVVREVLSGRYFRVSNGARDVLRDLVQPL
jgi:glycosyltransferase involved in cell wall biosynthesis/antitoxin (DNA-binding transcriptional repressor) of toxin-antitoxin stability system